MWDYEWSGNTLFVYLLNLNDQFSHIKLVLKSSLPVTRLTIIPSDRTKNLMSSTTHEGLQFEFMGCRQSCNKSVTHFYFKIIPVNAADQTYLQIKPIKLFRKDVGCFFSRPCLQWGGSGTTYHDNCIITNGFYTTVSITLSSDSWIFLLNKPIAITLNRNCDLATFPPGNVIALTRHSPRYYIFYSKIPVPAKNCVFEFLLMDGMHKVEVERVVIGTVKICERN